MWRLLPCNAVTEAVQPGPRSSHCMAAIGRQLYLFGGEMVPRVPVDNHMYKYDLSSQQWSRVKAAGIAPLARVAPAMAAINNKLYIFGGRTGIDMGEGVLDDLHVFDTDTVSWGNIDTKGEIPEARSFHSLVSDGEQLYLFGGCGKDRLNDIHSFDPFTSSWEKLPACDIIKPRGGAGLVHVDGVLYVIGGFIGEEVDDFFKYTISTKCWEEIKTVPNIPPLSVFGHGNIKGNLVIFGGEVNPSSAGHAGAGGFSNAAYEYQCKKPERGWQKVEVDGDVPSGRGWLPAAVTSGGDFVIYGGNVASNERKADMFCLTL